MKVSVKVEFRKISCIASYRIYLLAVWSYVDVRGLIAFHVVHVDVNEHLQRLFVLPQGYAEGSTF